MASPESIDPREWRQMRNDVDDGYSLLKRLDKSITKVSSTQRVHGNRLHEIQQSVDLAAGRLDRMEDNQRLQAARLSNIEETQTQQGERLGRVEETQTQQSERLGRVEGRLERIDGHLSGVDDRLGSMAEAQQQILQLLRGRPGG